MKRYMILFWHGLTGLLSSIAEWFTVVLGMKDDSKYGKILRRTIGTCFATIMLLVTAAVVWDFCRTACNRLNWSTSDYIPSYNNQYLSRSLTYHEGYDYDGYVFNFQATQHKKTSLINHIVNCNFKICREFFVSA